MYDANFGSDYFFFVNLLMRSNIDKSGDFEAIKLMYFQPFTSAIAHKL